MKASLKMSLNNKYFVKLINSQTGEVKQSGVFHNIPTINFYSSLIGHSTTSAESFYYCTHQFARIMSSLSVGSGTTAPAFTDTALASQLWTVAATSRVFKWLDDYTAQGTAVFTFPATTSYVGTITEVGLRNYQYVDDDSMLWNHSVNNPAALLCTRALLTDSEGQVISFQKTDIDILEVTVVVEINFTSTDNSFIPVKQSFWIRDALMGVSIAHPIDTYDFSEYYGDINLLRYPNDIERIRVTSSSNANSFEQAIASTPSAQFNADGACLRYNIVRLNNTVQTSIRFYRAMCLPGIGGWKLPNANVLTPYKIFDIHVGVGDGATNVFENPLDYFMKDTEVLYKNGTPLTRGVDYTINNFGNKNLLPEITDLMGVPKVSSEAVIDSTASYFHPLFVPSIFYTTPSNMPNLFDKNTNAIVFSNEAPLLLEYDAPVTMNCLKSSAGWSNVVGTTVKSLPVDTEFYLDYSTDGVTYQQVSSAKLTAEGGAIQMNFDDTTARYWRFRTSYTGNVSLYGSSRNYYVILTRKATDIIFTEAPADGDIITMDVDMDVIMKNENFVVDLSCRLNISL